MRPEPHNSPGAGIGLNQRKRQLLVDLSMIAFHDAGTGIQRVTRATFAALRRLRFAEFTIRPVAATRTIDYRYLPDDFIIGGPAPDLSVCERLQPLAGDVFLGLDLASMVMPHHEAQLAGWRKAGVSLHIFLFDMLPLLRGEWFRPAARRNYRRWLRTVERQADSVICQCQTVADQFERWNTRRWRPVRPRRVPAMSIPLSGDLGGSLPSLGLPDDLAQIEAWFARRQTVLAVGTVEPRKGYDQVLAAFELLWKSDPENAPQLLLAGKPGWKTKVMQKKLASRSSLDGPFLWVHDASDELLGRLYARASVLLFASRGEGFGLPIAEAIHRGLPVLFRDLPELQQFAGPGATQFIAGSPAELAKAVSQYLAAPPQYQGLNVHAKRTWEDVTIDLANALRLGLAPSGDATA